MIPAPPFARISNFNMRREGQVNKRELTFSIFSAIACLLMPADSICCREVGIFFEAIEVSDILELMYLISFLDATQAALFHL